MLRLPCHCFRAATKSWCESSLNCSSWSASFDSGVASRCAKSNGKSSCRIHSVLPVKTPRLTQYGSLKDEHRRFKRGAASIGARFRGSGTSYNGFSENFLVGREDFGG